MSCTGTSACFVRRRREGLIKGFDHTKIQISHQETTIWSKFARHTQDSPAKKEKSDQCRIVSVFVVKSVHPPINEVTS